MRFDLSRLRSVPPPADDDQAPAASRRTSRFRANDGRRGELNPDMVFVDGEWIDDPLPVEPALPEAEVRPHPDWATTDMAAYREGLRQFGESPAGKAAYAEGTAVQDAIEAAAGAPAPDEDLLAELREAHVAYRQYDERPSTMPPDVLRSFVDVTARAMGAGIDIPAFVADEDAANDPDLTAYRRRIDDAWAAVEVNAQAAIEQRKTENAA